MKERFMIWKAGYSEIFNLRDDMGKGRVINMVSGIIAALYNIFISGIFYTGFLTMYDISITEVGIISFIPYLASCFSVFSSMILERIHRRKPILLLSKAFFYAVIILATTVMPEIVHDPAHRLIWFVVLQFVGYSVYALFSTGFTPWFYSFYPADTQKRTRFISALQISSAVTSNVVLVISSIITDALEGSPYQNQLILGFRYFAYVLVLLDLFMQSRAKEPEYPKSTVKINFKQVFTLPFRYRKFLMCVILMFFWNFISTLNSGTWSYHLLNHIHLSYTLITSSGLVYTVILITTVGLWRKMLRRYSWVKTFGIVNLFWLPTEVFYFLMSKETGLWFIPLALCQNTLTVGMNLSYANIFYMNLPEENSTVHIAFEAIGSNLCAFLGMVVGTWVASWNSEAPYYLFGGIEIYGVQFTCLMRAVTMLAVGLICTLGWKVFTPQKDIDEVANQAAISRIHREMKKKAKAQK